jgi:hypothetical protein
MMAKGAAMPDDTSPHGGEALHPLPDRAKIPEPKPNQSAEGAPARGRADPDTVAQRPQLPGNATPMAADMEDEDADPVGGGVPDTPEETGKPSVTRQPG